MLIAIDIGNSSIHIGFFHNSVLDTLKIPTNPALKTPDYSRLIADWMSEKNAEKTGVHCIICSVVPALTPALEEAVASLPLPLAGAAVFVDHRIRTGLTMAVDAPDLLGADRIANAVAAVARYGKPVGIADFGSATTLTMVGKAGDLIGGAILPGIGMMNDVIGEKASLLKPVSLEPPRTALGKNTEDCIRSGILFGTAGAVERIISEIEREAGYPFRVVITGGYSSLASRFLGRPHAVDAHLTLEGLRILYEKNRNA